MEIVKITNFMFNVINNLLTELIIIGLLALGSWVLVKLRRKRRVQITNPSISKTFLIKIKMYENRKFNIKNLINYLNEESKTGILFIKGTDSVNGDIFEFKLKVIGSDIDHSFLWNLILSYQSNESENLYFDLQAVHQVG
ncbi:hypothetical protein [Mesobacillus jeotgali]|uniref:hypothetical protein n=1 Tax=Mesobacillus jeotgali TaxID=129985 RepID=UPI001CFC8DD9|nr:hypothetical protein [Mesobacillus jeotgali]